MRWNIGRNEQNASELVALACSARQGQVPAMDGIESAAKQPNIHAPLVSSFPAPVGKRSEQMGDVKQLV
jgi:hypothetical protein